MCTKLELSVYICFNKTFKGLRLIFLTNEVPEWNY